MVPYFARTICLLGAIGYELCAFGEIECHIPIFIPANPNPNPNRKLPSFNNLTLHLYKRLAELSTRLLCRNQNIWKYLA